jgi:hypothetical protein
LINLVLSVPPQGKAFSAIYQYYALSFPQKIP